MALVALIGVVLVAPAASSPVWCFARLEEAGGGGACAEQLGEEPVPLADCCLNPAYGYKLRPQGHCHTCRPGAWGPWSPWAVCSVTCGEGSQRRGRSRGSPPGGPDGHEGTDGHGDPREWQLRACHLPCCPEPGGWSPWSPWSSCSVTCGSGTESRARGCTAPAPVCGGSCPGGVDKETRMCHAQTPVCPVHGVWGGWGPWGPCGATCQGAGSGPSRSRSRRCDSPAPSKDPPGAACRGAESERGPCPGLPNCPVDGAWGAWSASSPCPVTCGLGAVLQRRSCDSPAPAHGGRGCHGNSSRTGLCGPHGPCHEEPQWGPWGAWSPCERPLWDGLRCEAAVGQQRRTRGCEGRRPGGPPCPTDPAGGGGGTIQIRRCYNVHLCLLPGNWSDWSPWGLCTPPCGDSPTRSRTRECQPIYPDWPPTLTPVGSAAPVPVWFWGSARPRCAALDGQRLRLEETRPCLHVPPCPAPHED